MAAGYNENQVPRGPAFIFWIFLLCCAMAGVQFVYSIQFAIGAPLLIQQFKLSASMIAIILTTSGAISGFIVQPIVGVYSDSCTSRFGRRRPFILAGMILVVVGMFFVGNSVQFGKLLGDNPDGVHPSDHKWGLMIAISCLWLINISVNAMQGPARALIADLVPAESQQLGNAILTATTGLSNVIANVVGAQFLMKPDPYRILFMIGCGFTALCTLPTLFAAKEQQYVRKEGEKTGVVDAFAKIGKSFVTMPSVVVRIFIVFFFSWCAYSPFMIYLTTYYGNNVENAGNDQTKFQHGVQLGMYGLALFAALSFLYSMIQTPLLKIFGVRPTYFLSQVIATACFGALWFLAIKNLITVPLALILTALVAINFTAFNSIPFALLAESVPNSKMGMYMGVLNSAATLSQVVTNILAGKVVVAEMKENVAWALCFGAGISALTSVLVWIIKTPEKSEKLSEREPLIQG